MMKVFSNKSCSGGTPNYLILIFSIGSLFTAFSILDGNMFD